MGCCCTKVERAQREIPPAPPDYQEGYGYALMNPVFKEVEPHMYAIPMEDTMRTVELETIPEEQEYPPKLV